MADGIEHTSQMMGQQGAAEGSQTAISAASKRSVLAEFADAAQSVAGALVQEQKQQIAERVLGMAEALEGAAHSLHQSQNNAIGRYVQNAGQHVRSLSRTLRERRWNEVIADIEDFARHQQTWFALGTVAVGFVVGRLLWTATNAPTPSADATREGLRRETTREVTAAVASAPGRSGGTGEATDHTTGSFATQESH
jgi:hypothetical protein